MGGLGKKRTRSTYTQPKVKGADRFYTMPIDFLDAACGTTTKLAIPGNGGSSKINVKIPAGVTTGSKIRLAGKGESSPSGGESGDLYLEIQVKDHPFFKRDGDDVIVHVPITPYEAALGGQIEVPTIAGKLKMKVPAGVQGGQKLRLKGKGIPHRKGGGVGDQYVILNVHFPQKLSKEGKALLEEFDKKCPFEPRKNLF